jgi:hypothetical protein
MDNIPYMNYRDIILKLLKKRPSVSVVEEFALSDFSNTEDPKAAFEKWCSQYHIHIERPPGERTITLTKSNVKTE